MPIYATFTCAACGRQHKRDTSDLFSHAGRWWCIWCLPIGEMPNATQRARLLRLRARMTRDKVAADRGARHGG